MNSFANTTANSLAARSNGLIFQRLCWKEARQIAPLALMLLVISLLLHLLPLGSEVVNAGEYYRVILVLMPCLFAVGAGALLVSQEKEQRTIGWLSSLPIASSQILRVKLFVSLVGLLVVWLASFLLAMIFNREFLTRPALSGPEFAISLWLTVLNSLFLLLLGIASAWRWQSPVVALAMIVPLATLPTFALLLTQSFSQENRLSDWLVVGCYMLFGGVFLWYGWHAGQAFLTSRPPSVVGLRLLKKFERRGSRGNLLSAKTQGIAATLLWQFAVQNRMLAISVVAIVVLPVVTYMFQTQLQDTPFTAIAAWLVTSWLGASVFQSDSVHQRIKFLAERGVAPRTIWWTRQFLPLGLVLVAIVVSTVLVREVMYNRASYSTYRTNPFPFLLLGLPAVLLAHAAAQWQGQLIRSSIVSLLVAPAVTLGAIGYMAFAIFTMGAPFWMIFVPIAIAFIATRVMMQPWMDARTGPRYWLGHAAFLIAAFGVPTLPFLVTAVTYPGMPRSADRSFEAEYRRYGVSSDPIELVLPANKQPAVGFVEQIERNVETIEQQLAQRSGAVRWSQAVTFLVAEAVLTRAQLDIEPANEASKNRYRTAMRILHEVVTRMRLSWRLVDQEFADRLERWMLEQVQLKDARENLGDSNWSAITRTLSDKAGRTAARRRAIVQSWGHARSVNGQLDLGGMTLVSTTGLAGWRALIADSRRVSRISWQLLQFLESRDKSEADLRFKEVATAWGFLTDRNPQNGLSSETGFQVPGQNWLGEWEDFREGDAPAEPLRRR